MKGVILLSLLMCFILTSSGVRGYKPVQNTVDVVFNNGIHVSAEVVDTRLAIRRGLMYREDMGEDEGMIFVFDREGIHSFWMMNVNFPLDIVWLDSDYNVVHVERDVPVCAGDMCPLYTPLEPAKFVLETRAGFTSLNDIDVGSQMFL